MLSSIVDCYMAIEASLIADHTFFISIKIKYHVSIFENMGVAISGPNQTWAWLSLEPPLLLFLEITTDPAPVPRIIND